MMNATIPLTAVWASRLLSVFGLASVIEAVGGAAALGASSLNAKRSA